MDTKVLRGRKKRMNEDKYIKCVDKNDEVEKMLDFGKVQADAVKNICKSKITGKAADYRLYGAITIECKRKAYC